jgi:hypothetical protein
MNSKNTIKSLLTQYPPFMVGWSVLAAFGAYFCMYAFRKPFSALTYEGIEVYGWELKSVLVIAMVLGYFISKLIGVKVIAELTPTLRRWLAMALIVVSELAWVVFGMVPEYAKPIIITIAALPLGMVWGLVFSYLEGRNLTELLAVGLCVSGVISSGILKSVTRGIDQLGTIETFWIPAVVGAFFLPLFLLFLWMLEQIPAPTEADTANRKPRIAMDNAAKWKLIKSTGILVPTLAILYATAGTLRDFRDNFGVEMLTELGSGQDFNLFARTETQIAILCSVFVGLVFLIKSHFNALFLMLGVMAIGLLMMATGSYLLTEGYLKPESWYLWVGIGAYLIFVPFQTVVFERLIAALSLKGNAGFVMYIADSSAYLGSVALVIGKETGLVIQNPLELFLSVCNWLAAIGLIALLFTVYALFKKYKQPITAYPIPSIPAL